MREEEAEQARQAATLAQSLVALRQSLASKEVPEMTEAEARDIELKKRKRKEEEEKTEEKETEAVGERRKQKIAKMANVSTTMILVKVVKS